MNEAFTREEGESNKSGFPLPAKLALLCSPLYLSLTHSWRMLILEQLSVLRPEMSLQDMFEYLTLEIVFSVCSLPVALLVDATIGVTSSLLSFLFFSVLAPILGSLAGLRYFDTSTRVHMLKNGAKFAGLTVIAFVLERAFFVRLMHVNSPSFRLYGFICYFGSTICQIVNAVVLFIPKLFPHMLGDFTLTWFQIVYQLSLWVYIMVMYCLVARFNRIKEVAGGNSFKAIVIIYIAIFYAFQTIWARIRWRDKPYKDIFEACERFYPKEVVNKMRQTFRLLIIVMCLMYLCGMELILRSIWFHQDDLLSRNPKPSILSIFPMEMMLLLYLVILYPIVNFLLIPFFRRKLHFRLSDLRLLGVSIILFNLSYISTMALEWAVMSASVSSPNNENIAIRIYNGNNPVLWTVETPETTHVEIFLPARMSRMYINDQPGIYQIAFNSSIISFGTTLEIEKGKPRIFLMRDGMLMSITSIERQLATRPNFNGDDSHLFLVNALINSTKEYLAEKQVEVSWKSEYGATGSTKINSSFTHIVLNEDTFYITLKVGNNSFDMTQEMNDHGVYSIMFYDSPGGVDNGYELEIVSVGFVYCRAWAYIQIILLAIGMAVGQIPLLTYTYRNAPPDMIATCFAFQRCAAAVSTFFVWVVITRYGLGPGPSTVSTMLIVLLTVLFIFLSVSDIVPSSEEDPKKPSDSQPTGPSDDIAGDSDSFKVMKSMLEGDLKRIPENKKSKMQISDRESIVSAGKD